MDRQLLESWPRDFETDLPTFPPGELTDFSTYKKVSMKSDGMRKLPILRGLFDPSRFDFTPGLPSHVGWGSVRLGRSIALTFRIQVGATVLYWFANAADKCIWEAIDKWDAAKTLALAAEFSDGRVLLTQRGFAVDARYSAIRDLVRHQDELTAAFLLEVGDVMLKDEVKQIASSDIASVARLQHVQACVVRSVRTAGVVVMANDDLSMAADPVAHAVACLAKQMLRPGERRH